MNRLRRRYGHVRAITPAQLRALSKIASNDLSGVRSSTYAALKAAGLIWMTFGDVEERYRPSRSFSGTRWTRTRRLMTAVGLTDDGQRLLAVEPR